MPTVSNSKDTDGAAVSPWDRVTVVMVVHNSAKVIPETLGAMTGARRIIVVDTVSSDDTADVAAAAHPAVEVIRNTEDFGLAAANNQGFDQAETEYVLHVNPDARVDPGCLEQLIETADANPNAAGVAPLLINGRGDMELDVMGARERHHHKLPEAPDGPFCTWFITGAVVLWRLSAVRSIDGFDAGFFMYNEDTDICLRSTRGGYSLILDPGVSAHHYGGASGGTSLKSRIRKDWMMAWGHLYFEQKYLGESEARSMARRYLRAHALESLLGLVLLRPKKFLGNAVKARAAIHFLRGKPMWGRDFRRQ